MEEITYNIDTEKNVIFTRIKGEINLFTLLIHMNRVENDEKFKKELNTLVDLTEAFIKINFDELSKLKFHFKEKEKIRGGCKWQYWLTINRYLILYLWFYLK